MKKFILVLLIGFALVIKDSYGQDFLNKLNSLPTTLIQKAPVFDVEKKYIFSIDSTNNLLFIQAFARNPKSLDAHFDQFIYEIPLSDLSAGSFLLLKKNEDTPLLSLEIGTTYNKESIISYFISKDQVELIQVKDVLSLGNWRYSDQLNFIFNEIINLWVEKITDKTMTTSYGGTPRTLFKYFSDKITIIGKEDTNKELNLGYYYVASLKKPSFYAEKKNFVSSNSVLKKDLKTELKRVNGIATDSNPVFINVDSEGQIESVFFLNQPSNVNKNINTKNFKTFNPGNDGSQNVKNKTILIIR